MARPFHGHKSIRLRNFDYGSHNVYFLTFVTALRKCNLSRVDGGAIHLSKFGRVAEDQWLVTLQKRPALCALNFVVMPNHIHALVALHCELDDRHRTAERYHAFQGMRPDTISSIVGGYKSAVTREVNRLRDAPGSRFWQDGFYDHVVRSEGDLGEIAEYIELNPSRWRFDRENEVGEPDRFEQEFWRGRLKWRLK